MHKKIPEIKPKHEITLSSYANIQNLIVNEDFLLALDNDNTVSIFKCKISKPDYIPPPVITLIAK